MAVSYKKLWKMLIDKDMKKKDLAELADVSSYTIKKIGNLTTPDFWSKGYDLVRTP